MEKEKIEKLTSLGRYPRFENGEWEEAQILTELKKNPEENKEILESLEKMNEDFYQKALKQTRKELRSRIDGCIKNCNPLVKGLIGKYLTDVDGVFGQVWNEVKTAFRKNQVFK